ncbi:hypothetical protein WJX72_004432 [[Myrmecia] bisecta]|uniref:Carboxypeptidase Taq n=1 Tax=[Myrmecia] bisecta TaxID=41462 RepID=A0AAW1Q3V2_9CHLO
MATAVAAPAEAVQQDYNSLCEKLREVSALGGISGLLGWDEQVMMPDGAAASRAAQQAVLAGVIYDKQTDAALGELLSKLDGPKESLGQYEAAVVREALREYQRTTAVPKRIAKRKAELSSEAFQVWVKAREASDFGAFAGILQEWVDLVKEQSAAIDPARSAYDVSLDEYEKGMTSARLDEIFVQVREGLVPLLKEIKGRGKAPDASFLSGSFDTGRQAKLCETIAKEIGFDLTRGRLDVSVHPFTGGAHPSDVRMTTRFKADDLTEGLTGAIHETGHALYEQGRNLDYDGLPVNQAMSMGIHESQSLFWERMVALSEPFSHYLSAHLKTAFPELKHELYPALNVVRDPFKFRVEADELSYPLHIILWYELEKGLLDGSVAVSDLPRLWNEKMQSYLGTTPKDDAQGCLQDVHWGMGAFGYFPTYSLGAMYACQIYQEAKKQLPGLEDEIRAGQFGQLRGWLNEKIHKVGSLYPDGDELMRAVTGAPLDPAIFLQYLRDKYSVIYQL